MMAVAGVLIHWVFKYPIDERAIQFILPSLLLSFELAAWSTWAAQRYDRSLGAVTRAALGFFLTNFIVVSISRIYFQPYHSYPRLGIWVRRLSGPAGHCRGVDLYSLEAIGLLV